MTTMDRLTPELRTFVKMYKWQRIDPVPWATMKKPLSAARVGLVINACMTMPYQRPFHAEGPDFDPSIRIIPSQADPQQLVNTYPGQAFDHSGLQQDANLLIPLDRLFEMASRGEIGEVAPRTMSLCGHLPKPERLIHETAPEIVRMFADDGVDVVMCVPA
jgi:hypothetical protein